MIAIMCLPFVGGYVLIAFEQKIKINKTASALVASMLLWVLYIFFAPDLLPHLSTSGFKDYLLEHAGSHLSMAQTVRNYVVQVQLVDHLGDVSETVFFLMGAMTIVELIDIHSGFSIITDRIHTTNKRKLLWLLILLTFFISAVIDNLTTTIVMVSLLNKIIPDHKERCFFAGMIVIAASSGGAWSPFGDVTTILLWVKDTITPVKLITSIFIPSVLSVLIPLTILSFRIKGSIAPNIPISKSKDSDPALHAHKRFILLAGMGGLLSIPFYKELTGLPPCTGVLLVLGILWMITDYLYRDTTDATGTPFRVGSLIKRIDLPTQVSLYWHLQIHT